jgi:hypothetical protein
LTTSSRTTAATPKSLNVDKVCFYIAPVINPDGRYHFFADANSPDSSRSIRIPTDDDRDGLVDEADPDVTGRPTWYRDADGDGLRDLDSSRMYFFGISYGGAMGTVFLAVEPDVVMLDPWYKTLSGEENDNSVVKQATDFLDSVIEGFKTSIIIIHHPARTSPSGAEEALFWRTGWIATYA